MTRPILVSACLLGLATRYDGAVRDFPAVRTFLAAGHWLPIPVCPEQLGGLPTPRPPVHFLGGDGNALLAGKARLADDRGRDLGAAFLRGAAETARIAALTGADTALLKERSPSCGVRQIHRGAEIIAGQGVTAAMLTAAGLTLLSEEELAAGSAPAATGERMP